jgi:putative DNA primase/helicase
MVGVFGCWKRGIKEKWHARNGKTHSKDEWDAIRRRLDEARRVQEQTEVEAHRKAREVAQWIYTRTSPIKSHDYLLKKNVAAHGPVMLRGENLVLPLRDAKGILHSLQFIGPDGTKRFLRGGRIQGAFYTISDQQDGPLYICEGYSTGATIFEATGRAVICAMNSNNLAVVATDMRAKHPAREIVIAGDDDHGVKGNPGVTKATEAATAIKAKLVIAKFDGGQAGTDFNDLAAVGGINLVREQLKAASEPAESTEQHRAKSLFDLESRRESDPDELLKDRYLCRGGILLIVAPTGVGKSVFEMQLKISFALGHECFGIRPARPLSSLLIQAENDEGDIAEMRDGVIHGLRLTPGQIEEAKSRTFIHTEDSKTGAELVALVDRLLEVHKTDLLELDPALSYLGGDARSGEDVGRFLRNQLNPVLHRHGCGCILVHHTNKPASGKEKADWQAGDFAYLGSGSAEWANVPRAIMALRSIGSHDIYELRAGKRGARLGWKDAEGKTSYSRLIGHSNEPGFIYWRDASEDELNRGGRPKDYSADELLELLPFEGLATTEWLELAGKELGIKERRFYQLVKSLKDNGRILKSKVNQKWQPITKRA